MTDLFLHLADALRHRRSLRDLSFGEGDLRLRLLQGGLGRVHVLLRGRLPAQGFLAVVIGLRLGERRLGRRKLGLRLGEQGGEILPRHLKTELLAAHLRLGGGQRAFGKFAVDLVLARIDVDQRVALPDKLIVGDIQRDNGAATCGAMSSARPSV